MTDEKPLIIGFVADLIAAARIEPAAEALGFRVEWIERQEQVAPVDPQAPARQYAEHLVGPGAALLDRLTEARPALILFDLGNGAIPWREWLALIKSVPATRRIPVVGFGPHVNAADLKEARRRGADEVLPRSQFLTRIPDVIRQWAAVPDEPALAAACQEPLSAMAIRGLEAFNHGEYFEAHELLENAWNEDQGPGRELYRAVLQVAVAYLQIERGNYNGAMKMFLRLRQWIGPLPAQCRGIEIGRLREDAVRAHRALKELGAGRIHEFDRRLLRRVEYRRAG